MRAKTLNRVNAPKRLHNQYEALQISLMRLVRLYFPLRINFLS